MHNLGDKKDLTMNARKSYVAWEDKGKGLRCYSHSSSPTAAKVSEACPPTISP